MAKLRLLFLNIQNTHNLSRNTGTQKPSVLKKGKKEKYSGSIVKMHLYCDYKDLIPLISHMIGNQPCTYIFWCLMSRILHVQDEASVRKMEGSDYEEIKYMAVSAGAGTPSLIC